jgi:hypothetical protein
MSFVILCGLVSAGATALFAQTESASRFTGSGLNLRESLKPFPRGWRKVSVARSDCDYGILDW